ncbi:MAG: tRNA pseudouridine(54/55) synthase Pus10 [Candidatus Ranarchaeia archaeon]|jgi:tRNA pseudouridine synthase 10
MTNAKIVNKLLKERVLCNHCLGRQFALLGTGTTNFERGKSLKMATMLEAHEKLKKSTLKGKQARKILELLATNGQFIPAQEILKKLDSTVSFEPKECDLCHNLFSDLPKLVDKTLNKLEKTNIEFDNFLIGSIIPPNLVDTEDSLREEFNLIHGEALKREFNREFGKLLYNEIKKETVFDQPHLLIMVNLKTKGITFQIYPVFIAGRYLKKVRGIPQTKWPCPKCNGAGCEICNGTGRMYPNSIEEFVSTPVISLYDAKGERFHAAGREDIDARMLGSGRPFVLEILSPKKRHVDLDQVQKAVNKSTKKKVEIKDLHYSSKSEARELKANSSLSHKTYKAKISVKHPVSLEQLTELDKTLTGAILQQQTPTRVSHRRANLIRKKHIYSITTRRVKKTELETILTCQGGLYVKELISGDGGRTRPSFTEILKTPAECMSLDVLDVATEAYENGKES